MPVTILARNPEDLAAVVRVLHDCWFDKDEIRFDSSTATLAVRFTKPSPERGQPPSRPKLLKRVEIPYLECFLGIHHVHAWHLKDTEEVGLYDFNEINFDPQTSRIEITTGIPLSFLIEVERLEVTAEVTDTVAKLETRRRLF